ncbi:uroporphyrin-III C-methyltransferase [Gemmatirosa kalamazoonensis]|uniref:Uroporphyrin-III C-methyltransferase n=1 Tax=Gemmatirosa kalamazoonensis TaxID=861299 RepID=W0RE83_9BACT|nr:siroheme synthase CysG [Gemmatirosa kalamazoonensis]AHG88640.1 uroporphyrin-III C-methyltransferase [Gemmatirosa kalamazoonensis]
MSATPRYYPVMLDLTGRLAVVVGGGAVAAQKARELAEAGARVRVVAPEVGPAMAELSGVVTLERRAYREGDLAGAAIAVAATDDRAVNHAVWEEAEAAHVLLNAVDDVAHCHFIAPSVHREGDITVTVSTAGHCPTLAVRLRERIARVVRREHGEFARLAGALRTDIARRVPDFAARRALWYRIVDSDAIDAVRRGETDEALLIIERLVREAERGAWSVERGAPFAATLHAPRSTLGVVHLVGAGPGDAELITMRGLRLLRSADVVVYDQLVGAELLTYARPDARLVCVGKHGHGAFTPQQDIDALLIAEARAGRRVVRLKGGDPFVFGRGGEEMAALRAAGVRCEVVPGVSSAVAAPAAAGIPLTHRALASGFAVVTGHECGEGTRLDWSALARVPTLVVLMGLRALPNIVGRLAAHGLDLDTPAAVVSRGTLPDQRVVTGTLATIADLAAAADLAQPATLVIGEVVRLRDAGRLTTGQRERDEGSVRAGAGGEHDVLLPLV